MPARTLVLWRHGRTSSNAEHRFQGQLDVGLDDVGRRQVAASAAQLALLRPTAVVSSDLVRAADTARALLERTGLPLVLDADLREVHVGEWQGLLGAEVAARWPDELAAWRGSRDVRPPGGERRSEAAARTTAAVERHAALVDDGTLVVTGHGAALKAAMLRLLDLPPEASGAFASFANARWAVLVQRSQGWALAEYNAGPPGAQG